MKVLLNILCTVSLVVAPITAHAESALFVPAPVPTPAPAANIPSMGNSNINKNSGVGQASQQAGSGANNSAGAALIAAGIPLLATPPTMPIGAMLIAMGAMAMAQGGHDAGAAGQSGNTGAASTHNNNTPTQASTSQEAEKGKSAFDTPEIKKAVADIEKLGYKVDEKGVKLPDGTLIPTSAFASKEGMLAAGIDPAVLSKLDQVNKDVSSEYKVSSMATSSGGGGGAPSDVESGSSNSGGMAMGGPFDMSDDARRRLAAGRTVNLDGEPIGVAGANIFEMIHTAYQKKRTGAQFLEVEEPMVRMPASVTKEKR
jgi:hypothetical protein